jgi:predicted XRE-type DNA-binding protein
MSRTARRNIDVNPARDRVTAEDHLVKGQLVSRIDTIMKDRGLKQIEAAGLFGIRQPDVSKMLRGDFRRFSVERLLRFLVALNQDVEIVIKPHLGLRETPTVHISEVTKSQASSSKAIRGKKISSSAR